MSTMKILLLMELLMAAMVVVTSLPVDSTNTDIENFCLQTMNQSKSVTQECLMKPNAYSLTNEGDRAVISYLCCLGYFCIGREGVRKDVTVYLGYADPSVQRLLMRLESRSAMETIAKTLKCKQAQNTKKIPNLDGCILMISPDMFPKVQKASVSDIAFVSSHTSSSSCED